MGLISPCLKAEALRLHALGLPVVTNFRPHPKPPPAPWRYRGSRLESPPRCTLTWSRIRRPAVPELHEAGSTCHQSQGMFFSVCYDSVSLHESERSMRSEERRVGKECRSGEGGE